MTSPYYRGEGGENTRHRVTGGVSTYNIWYDAIVKYCRMTSQIHRYTVPVATGRGEGRRFFLGTQTQLGCQTRVGYAGWCTGGTEEC